MGRVKEADNCEGPPRPLLAEGCYHAEGPREENHATEPSGDRNYRHKGRPKVHHGSG